MQDMYICLCNAVKKSEIELAILDGHNTLERLQEELDVANNCGACACDVQRILKESENK